MVRDLAARVRPAPVSAPAACILDSGTNRGHPLLSGSLAKDDQHAVDANWGVDDHYRNGHGTQMAGLALFGDLTYPVADNRTVTLTHRLETVTLLPPDGFKRFGQTPHGEIDAGILPIHRLEIARADNDPSLPENGRIDFVMKGGF